jgi:hypothetical protein
MNRPLALVNGAALAALVLGSLAGWTGLPMHLDPTTRLVTGSLTAGLIAAQWALTLGRTTFQRSGRSWDRWVATHRALGYALPAAVWAHTAHLGYGLLAILPLSLLSAALLGTALDTEAGKRRFLSAHIVLAGLTAAATAVHLYMVIAYN